VPPAIATASRAPLLAGEGPRRPQELDDDDVTRRAVGAGGRAVVVLSRPRVVRVDLANE
jgi:hypothetical protein